MNYFFLSGDIKLTWPNPSDYQDTVQNPKVAFSDTELSNGVVAVNRLGLPRVASGNFASVYEIQSGSQRYAVRCLLRQVSDQQQRYERVSRHLERLSLPSLVDFDYLVQGIRIHGQWYPIVKMEWVEGVSLHKYVEQNLHNAAVLGKLAARWRGLVNSLRGSHLAHGDLQHGNVLVTASGDLKLVDYDAMFVPTLHGERSNELGHANYQHPKRNGSDYDERLDSFAALVIYLSLRALAADASLWQQLYTGENLIFSSGDYKAPVQSAVFRQLQNSSDLGVRALAAELERCCLGTMAQIEDFESIVHALQTPSVSPQLPLVRPPSSPSPQTQSQPSWNQTSPALPPTTSLSPACTLPIAAVLAPPSKTLPLQPTNSNIPVQAAPQPAPALSQTTSTLSGTTQKPPNTSRQANRIGLIFTCIVILAGIAWQILWNNLSTNTTSSRSVPAIGNTERPIFNTVGSDRDGEKSNNVEPPLTPPRFKKNSKDNADMVFIPAGEFTMGSTQSEIDDLDKQYTPSFHKGEGPQHKVMLDDYYIYRTPVTVAQYLKFCDETGHSKPPAPTFNPNWEKRDHPIVNVSYNDALAYCEWAGVKLPTEAQWEKAARGTDARAYPWGNVFDSSKLCCSKSQAFGDSSGTASAGSFPDGASPFGVLDMAGNVWQWCSDWYDKDFYSSRLSTDRNPENRSVGEKEFRVLRGGSWNISHYYPFNFRSDYRLYSEPGDGISFDGFRCASGL